MKFIIVSILKTNEKKVLMFKYLSKLVLSYRLQTFILMLIYLLCLIKNYKKAIVLLSLEIPL